MHEQSQRVSMDWIGTRIDHDPSADKGMPDKPKKMTKKIYTASTMRRIEEWM